VQRKKKKTETKVAAASVVVALPVKNVKQLFALLME
jgi:hypothetical protein